MTAATSFIMLPQDCISTILSLTAPADACRVTLASSSFRTAADSNTVWNQFLPNDISSVLSRMHAPVDFSSKKNLYFQLCDSIHIDGGMRSFSLNKASGKKCCILSAKALSISLSNEPNHWNWTTDSVSRFSEVIELKTISAIDVEGRINTGDLSSHTMYGAYLIIKVSDCSFGLDSIPSETSVSKDGCSVTNTAYLCPLDDTKNKLGSLFFMNRRQMMNKRVAEGEGRRPSKREDGWMEIELGEFFVGVKNDEVKMKLIEAKGHQLKGGLVIEGIEVRPKY